METLVELVARITADASELKKGLSDAEGQTETSSKRMADSLKKVGMAMAASGAAITAAMSLMGKSAIDEEINIKRLGVALKGVGISYDDVKGSLEGVIAATQRKTGIADDQQRDVLGRLILVTKDYNKAISLLPLTLDLAAAGQMDASTAATYLSKAYLELENGAKEIGIRIGQATVNFKNLDEVQKLVGGTAEATANPFNVLSASIGDMAEAIGANLIPLIKVAVDKIVDITVSIQRWVAENPEFARTLTLVGLGLGIVLVAVGGLVLAMPTLTGMMAAFGVVFHFALGPIGLISIAIMALIAIGVTLWQNWDTISNDFVNMWIYIKNSTLKAIYDMLGALQGLIGFIPGLSEQLENARNAIAGMINADNAVIEAKRIERAAKDMAVKIKASLEEQKAGILKNYADQRAAAQSLHDKNIKAINDEYGVSETATRNKISDAKDLSAAVQAGYQRDMDAARKKADSDIKELNRVYNTTVSLLDAATNAKVKALQDQIDAIDNATKYEELALTRLDEKNRIDELQAAVDSATTAEGLTKAKTELSEYQTEVARKELLRQRDAEKDALRDEINRTQEQARNEKDRLRDSLDANITNQESIRDNAIENLRLLGIAEDKALVKGLADIEKNRLAAITAEANILTAKQTAIATLEENTKASYLVLEADAAVHQAAMEATLRDIHRTVITTYASQSSGGSTVIGGYSGGEGNAIQARTAPGMSLDSMTAFMAKSFAAEGLASGGIVTQPTMALIGEAGPEAVIPLDQMGGGVTVNFTQPVFFDREDTMNKFVDMIRKGIQRQDRLRYGGAYNG